MAAMESETRGYNLDNIRTLLMRGFSSAELRRLCYDHPAFRQVSAQIPDDASQADIVEQILAYALDRKLLDPLLEWAEQNNPLRFRLHLPYHDSDTRQGQEESAYNLGQIRSLLTEAFTPQTLIRLCQDRLAFRPVLNQFAPDDGLANMVDRLLAFAEQRVLLGDLLEEVRLENPRQYERFQPFLVDESGQTPVQRSSIGSYNRAAVRELITAALTAEELRRFCQDRPEFRRVFYEFGPGDGLDDMVDQLLAYVERGDLYGELLAEVRQANPHQYARFESRLYDSPQPQRPPPKKPTREPQFWIVIARPDQTDWDVAFQRFQQDPGREPIHWTGIHNPTSQTRLKRARQGDYVLAYYSAPGRREITGFGQIATDPYELDDGRSAVDIRPVRQFENGVLWETLKAEIPSLEKVRAPQISFSKVTAEEYAKLHRLILDRNPNAGLEELLPKPEIEEPIVEPPSAGPDAEPTSSGGIHIVWGGNQPPAPPQKEDRIRIHVTEKNVTLWHGDLDRPYKSLNHLEKYPELDQEETLTPREYGRLLFKGIIHGEGSRGFRRRPTSLGYYGACEQAQGKPRIELRIEPELSAYMWEYLTDPRDDEPLAVSEEAPFYRLHGAADKEPVQAEPLNILFAICNPTDLGSSPGNSGEQIPRILGCLERLDTTLERKIIVQGMQDPVDRKLAEYDILEGTETGAVTLAAIRDQLRKKPYHILHLLAHGVYMRRRKRYALVMEAPDRRHAFVYADDFDKAMFGSDLRLIVLAACQSGRLDLGDSLQALAPILVERDVPAVIAMQRDLPVQAAQLFARRFYGDLARTGRIDMAMAATRHDLYTRDRKSWSWGIPMLMTSSATAQLFNRDQGRLFDVADDQAERFPRPTFRELEQGIKDYAGLDSEDPSLGKLTRALETEIRAHGYGRDQAFLSTMRAAIAPHLAARPPKAEALAPGQERESLSELATGVKMDAAGLAAYVAGHSKLTLPPSTFGHIASTLNAGKHIILIGAHGTGKTSLAQDICAYAAQKNFAPGAVLTTATADWTTFDTVGGYVPTQDGTLQFRLGIFLEALRSGRWLVIDEINRAEIDKAFGELFTVLSGQEVELPYKVGDQALRVLPPQPRPKGAKVDPGYWIPSPDPGRYHYVKHPNWRIVGTMNVYDKSSLFQLSFAFMRRFAFVDVDPPADEHFFYLVDDWLDKAQLPVVTPAGKNHFVPDDDCKPIQQRFRQLLHRRPLPQGATSQPTRPGGAAEAVLPEDDGDRAAALEARENPLMARRELGPAIIKDMIAYMGDRYQALGEEKVLKLMGDRYRALDEDKRLLTLMGEAFLLYVVPHLDGLDYEGIRKVHVQVGELFADVDEERRQILRRIELLYPHIHDWDED